ncbi:MAG: hypothetical protein QXE05_09270 [Nitrososphaeria archaeon]
MTDKELSVDDHLILIDDQVNYALNEIKEIEKRLSLLEKDNTEHYTRIVQLGIDMTDINSNVEQLGADFFNSDSELHNKQAELDIQINQIKTDLYNHQLQISSLRELVNALFDALNILTQSINQVRDKKE